MQYNTNTRTRTNMLFSNNVDISRSEFFMLHAVSIPSPYVREEHKKQGFTYTVYCLDHYNSTFFVSEMH